MNNLEKGLPFKAIRNAFNYTIVEVSELCDISKSYISEIESGYKYPKDSVIEKYCSGLNINKDSLYHLIATYEKEQWSYQMLLFQILKTFFPIEDNNELKKMEIRCQLATDLCSLEICRQETLLKNAEKQGNNEEWLNAYSLLSMYSNLKNILTGNTESEH